MASFDEDERLARQLQEEENELARKREAEEMQRKVMQANSNFQNPLQHQSIRTPHTSAVASRITSGQIMAVRLQHPLSGNQIDEPMYAHCGERGLMMFELVRNRDTYMRTKSNGKIEFSTVCDDKARYFVESAPNGTIYLTSKGHFQKPNTAGSMSWNMALNLDGSLAGNSDRNPRAQWRLVTAGDVPPWTPSQTQQLKGSPLLMTSSEGSSVSSGSLSPPRYDASPVSSAGKQRASQTNLNEPNNESPLLQVSVEQQMKWFSTRVGQLFLQREPRLMQMYQDGTLQKVLHRPDWNQIALKWKDYKALPIPYNSISSENLTISHLQCFFDQGYTKVDKIIPSNFISSALKVINYWLGQYPIPKANLLGNVELTGAILSDPNLMELLYETPIIDMVQSLLGVGNVTPCVECGISLRYPQLTGDESSTSSKKSELGGRRWFVDNSDPTTPEDRRYSILVAIPLSDMTNSFVGNLCVFPESHERVYDILLERTKKSPAATTSDCNLSDELDMNKPDLGEPIQIMASPGDVIFLPGEISPRRDSPNYSCNIRYMVYFRVAIEIPAVYASSITEGMWSLFNPSIAPRERRRKSVIAPNTEGNFLL